MMSVPAFCGRYSLDSIRGERDDGMVYSAPIPANRANPPVRYGSKTVQQADRLHGQNHDGTETDQREPHPEYPAG